MNLAQLRNEGGLLREQSNNLEAEFKSAILGLSMLRRTQAYGYVRNLRMQIANLRNQLAEMEADKLSGGR